MSCDLAPCPERAARTFGWVSVRMRTGAGADELLPVLTELRDQRCGHTWRRLLPDHGPVCARHAAAVIDAELQHRPTWFFTYAGVRRDGSEDPFGVATVAQGIAASFPYSGFPVLARSYVGTRFRSCGLYGVQLRHRLAVCLRRWDSDLRAIHLGTTDPRVRCATENPTNTRLPFLHVGDELLDLPGGPQRVPDYVAFAPGFVSRLRAEIDDHVVPLGTRGRPLIDWFERLIHRGLGSSGYGALCRSLSELEAAAGCTLRSAPEWRSLLALLDTIPVLR